MLVVNNLHAFYRGNEALKGVCLEVSQGEVVALVGANGAGKTTFLNCLSGIHSDKTGEILFQGQNVSKTAPHEMVKLGVVQCPENRQLFGPMTVRENLELGAYTLSSRVGGRTLSERMEELLDIFPALRARSDLPASTLSGGEQQMLAIARSLMSNPTLLMLDEPSLGLAPMLVEEIFKIIRNLKNRGRTILLVEQNAVGALNLSDRAYLLETGSVTLSGSSEAFMSDARVIRAYLGDDIE